VAQQVVCLAVVASCAAVDGMGAYEVTGPLAIARHDGEPIESAAAKVYLCRCGRSANKPFRDGARSRTGWTEASAASRRGAGSSSAVPALAIHETGQLRQARQEGCDRWDS
jgi:CDGSH-type Zn-finger protein